MILDVFKNHMYNFPVSFSHLTPPSFKQEGFNLLGRFHSSNSGLIF